MSHSLKFWMGFSLAQCVPTRCLSSCEKLIFHFIEGLEIRVNAVALGKKDTYLLELEHGQ